MEKSPIRLFSHSESQDKDSVCTKYGTAKLKSDIITLLLESSKLRDTTAVLTMPCSAWSRYDGYFGNAMLGKASRYDSGFNNAVIGKTSRYDSGFNNAVIGKTSL